MNPWNIEDREGIVCLKFGEEVGIQHAASLKTALDPFATPNRTLRVYAAKLLRSHTAVVQLLMAWKKNGGHLEIIETSNEFTTFMERLAVLK